MATTGRPAAEPVRLQTTRGDLVMIRDLAERIELAGACGCWAFRQWGGRMAVDEADAGRLWRAQLEAGSGPHRRIALVLGPTGERLVGMAGLVPPGATGLTGSTDPRAMLVDLFVAAESRGDGLGRLLVEDIVRLARARGIAKLYLETDRSLAHGFYAKSGWMRILERGSGGSDPSVVMVRRLERHPGTVGCVDGDRKLGVETLPSRGGAHTSTARDGT